MKRPLMDCAAYQRWFSPYVDALLAQHERDELEAHLNGCPRCRADLESLQEMLRSLRALEPPDTPELLPGVHAKLAREPWWQRLARRFVAPWPASLPLHGVALATTALLVIVVVGTQRPMRSLVDRKEQADWTTRPLANQTVAYEPHDAEEAREDVVADQGMRSSVQRSNLEAPASLPVQPGLAQTASGASLETTATPGTVADEVGADQPAMIADVTSGAAAPATCPPCEKKRAELARQWEEHPQVQWQVSDLASAAAQLNGWVQSKGGSVTTIDEHRLSVTLPEASVSEFLTQFSSSVSAPARISLDATPDSTRWVTISLELLPAE